MKLLWKQGGNSGGVWGALTGFSMGRKRRCDAIQDNNNFSYCLHRLVSFPSLLGGGNWKLDYKNPVFSARVN